MPSALSAILSEIRGKVEIKQAGQDVFAPANADSFLNENGQVQTGDDGRVRLDLSTGTIIRVAPASLFTLILNEPAEESLKTSLELLLGKIFIILNGGSMEVQTPSGTAAVRGSYMSVEYNPPSGGTRITCLEGNCSLATASSLSEREAICAKWKHKLPKNDGTIAFEASTGLLCPIMGALKYALSIQASRYACV
jgi:hypothetical protein